MVALEIVGTSATLDPLRRDSIVIPRPQIIRSSTRSAVGPVISSTIRPRDMTTTRSQRPASSSGSLDLTIVATPSFAFSFRWQRRNGAAWVDIPGATDESYLVRAADAGRRIRVEVTASNFGGAYTATAVSVPVAAHVHVFVAVGDAELDGAGPLATGDAARLTDAGSPTLRAGTGGAEVLVWATA